MHRVTNDCDAQTVPWLWCVDLFWCGWLPGEIRHFVVGEWMRLVARCHVMSCDVIWCVFILCDAISCVVWCHMMHWDVMWWLLCDATPTCENGMVSSELHTRHAVHSDKLGIKTWPNQHEASPTFLFCIAVGPKEVRSTSRLTAWSGQLDLPHAPTLAHRGACHRNAKDRICTRPAVHTLGSRPKCVGWCQTSDHSNSSKAQEPTVMLRQDSTVPYQRTGWSTQSYAHAKPSTATSLPCKHNAI